MVMFLHFRRVQFIFSLEKCSLACAGSDVLISLFVAVFLLVLSLLLCGLLHLVWVWSVFFDYVVGNFCCFWLLMISLLVPSEAHFIFLAFATAMLLSFV